MWNKYTIGFNLLLFLLSFPSQYSVMAQEKDKPLLVDGKLWDLNGDTIEGKIIYINQYNFQFNLTLADTSGKPIKNYSPKELTGFCYFLDDNVEVAYESMTNPTDIGKVFLRVLYKGDRSVYQFLDINYRSTSLSYLTFYYLWDREWLDPPFSAQNQTAALLHHFSNCPELEYKIKTGEYNLTDIRQILEEYKDCRKTDEYEFFYE